MNIRWITTSAELKSSCQSWQQQPALALDTEFIRVDTFYPIAGLIQVSDGTTAFLLDPLTIDDWSAFASVLNNPNVVKVLHACSEDLEVFQRLIGTLPTPLFDTQIACSYLNIGFSLGYSRLVEAILGIHLGKEETRSDWLQRPLTPTQEEYAAQDTVYLLQVYDILQSRLTQEKYDWVLADGQEIINHQQQLERNISERWQQVKLAWKLGRQQLAVLRAVSQWREGCARQRDVPRNRVLRENCLWAIATQQPQTIEQLARIPEISSRTVRQDGEQLLQLIAQSASLPEDQWPERLPMPLSSAETKLYKELRSIGVKVAEQLNIAAEIVMRRKVAEDFVRSAAETGDYQIPEALTGWRHQYLAPLMLDTVRE